MEAFEHARGYGQETGVMVFSTWPDRNPFMCTNPSIQIETQKPH